MAISLNTHFNAAAAFRMPYWSLSQCVTLKVKNAVNFISAFEETLAGETLRRKAYGVICGHIHHAVMRETGSSHHVNCGDWVESCTAVVEHLDGRLAIIDLAKQTLRADVASSPDRMVESIATYR